MSNASAYTQTMLIDLGFIPAKGSMLTGNGAKFVHRYQHETFDDLFASMTWAYCTTSDRFIHSDHIRTYLEKREQAECNSD